MVQNYDVLFSVFPRVLVVEPEGVKDLVDDVTHGAPGTHKQRLLPTDDAHEWRAAMMEHIWLMLMSSRAVCWTTK